MGSANVQLAREYLRAVESMGPPENVSRFYSADIEFHEFPNRIVPNGRVRKRGDLQAAYGQAQKLLSSQRYDVRRVVENGDEVAVELEWSGVLAIAVPSRQKHCDIRFHLVPRGQSLTRLLRMRRAGMER